MVVALGLTAGGVILSQMNFHWPWESDKFTFQVEFNDAVAVSPGNSQEVRIAGVKVGDIRAAQPTDHNTSLVTVAVDAGNTIYDNARAVLRPKNPLNEMYVEISPGGPPGKPLPPGGVIPVTQTERPVQPEEVFDHLDDRARAAVTSLLDESDVALASAPQTLPGGLTATDDTLVKLQPVVDALAKRRENIQQLVTAISQISAAAGNNDQRLTSLVDATQQTLGVLAQRNDQLGSALGKLPGFTDELNRAMQGTAGLTAELDPALTNLNQAASGLPGALAETRQTVDELGRTVQSAKPVVAKAGPVVADLGPITAQLNSTFGDLKPVTAQLGYATAQLAPWMYDLGAFVYNTNSIFSVSDANGGLVRGHVSVDLQSPLGMTKPGDRDTDTYRDGGSPLGPYPAPGQGG
ncbi:hypothetical protein GCM10017788_60710 [Amycolatopsis acidiphila]|nr:hypothetical protein GCM10017788_60710 [Amycolatopsis acidiphila]